MKNFCPIFIVVLFFIFGTVSVFPCTCVLDDLSKRFKKANAVFTGEIYDYDDEDISKIQNYKKGLPVLSVNKSWKGVQKEFVAIDFADFPKSVGTCPILYRFEEDKEYLIFAYGKELKIEVECSDTRELKGKYDYTMKEISRLDSFWFRFWAKVKPF